MVTGHCRPAERDIGQRRARVQRQVRDALAVAGQQVVLRRARLLGRARKTRANGVPRGRTGAAGRVRGATSAVLA